MEGASQKTKTCQPGREQMLKVVALLIRVNDSQSYNFGGLLQYAYKKWLFKEELPYQRTSARPNGTTADKFYTMARADYSLSDHNFYGSTDYTRDMFNGYVYVVEY